MQYFRRLTRFLHVLENQNCLLFISEEELVEEEEVEQQNVQPTAKIGAKKQKKLEEKQAKKAQREVNISKCLFEQLKSDLLSCTDLSCVVWFSGRDGGEGGEEEDAGAQGSGKKAGRRESAAAGTETGQGLSPLSNSAPHPAPNLCVSTRCWDSVLMCLQEEMELRAKEEQEKREEEEYLKLKASFVIEDQGEEEQLTEDQVSSLFNQ